MKRVLQVVLGLSLGLVLTELLFWLRDGGAFPHVNFYVPDAERGVRLEPNVSQRLQLGNNPLTTAHTNSQGFRGAEWPQTTGDDVIVVGDSQVFGLGVEDDETFSARLGTELKAPVLNAGVPTYGPREYLATAAELLKTRRAKHVVVVINASNDFFEVERPNLTRHAVWDGWAVRKETAPTEAPLAFPGRHWLMSRSHAVYALRRLASASQTVDAVESEGHWKDVVELRPTLKPAAPAELRGPQLESAKKLLAEPMPEVPPVVDPDDYLYPPRGNGVLRGIDLERASKGNPGDIVSSTALEAARSVKLTAEMIQLAGAQLVAARKQQQVELEQARRERAADIAYAKRQQAARADARAAVQKLRWDIAPAQVVLPAAAETLKNLVVEFEAKHGVAVTLVVLPLDVQVSAEEWKKYGAAPLDLSESVVMHRLLVEAVQAKGVRAIDLLPALQAAEPGAFLDGDLHLTKKGHQAVAKALAAVLRADAPPKVPRLELPSPSQWDAAPPLEAVGAPDGCDARVVGKWMRVHCRGAVGVTPLSVSLVEGDARDVALSGPHLRAAGAVLPLEPKQAFTLRFDFGPGTNHPDAWARSVRIEGAAPLKFVSAVPEDTDLSESDTLYRYGTCANTLLGDPTEVWGNTTEACLEAYEKDCVELLACAQGHPDVRPKCPRGEGRAGRCL